MASAKTDTVNAEKTMELLWARVRQRGDLPGFSKVVSAIIGAMRGDDDREFNMTKTVLSDPALTQRVLRLANSAMYSVFGQGINTVSKAVIVLGTEAIGHLALGLKLIDGLTGASIDSVHARNEMEKAVLAGHIARQVAATVSARDAEEAVVCSMLHSLGRMMVSFYLPEKWEQIQACCAESGMSEDAAGSAVLGVGFDEIGRIAGKQWGLPASLINTLLDMSPRTVDEPLDHADWLTAISTLASRCAAELCSTDEPDSDAIRQLAEDYADMLGVDASHMLSAVEAAQKTAAEEDSALVRSAKPTRRPEPVPDEQPPSAPAASGKPLNAVMVLTRGVADMREALQTVNMGQLITMALETVYQGLGCGRTIAFLHDQDASHYAARKGLGENVQELLPRLAFPDAYQPDVFHAAVATGKMIFVENALDPNFASKVPRWWKNNLLDVRSFMVLPLTMHRKPVGLIYGDWDLSTSNVKIKPEEIIPLDELRSLVTKAIEHRRQIDPYWAQRPL